MGYILFYDGNMERQKSNSFLTFISKFAFNCNSCPYYSVMYLIVDLRNIFW